MEPIGRRSFVEAMGATAGLAWLGAPAVVGAVGAADGPSDGPPDKTVHLSGDGLGLSTESYAALLSQLCRASAVAEDNYLLGGEVERFERHWAELLGKETAVFMPSGRSEERRVGKECRL